MEANGKLYTTVVIDDVVEETMSGYIDHGAILVRVGEESHWLPKSQLEDWPEVGDGGEVIIVEWLAIRKGLV